MICSHLFSYLPEGDERSMPFKSKAGFFIPYNGSISKLIKPACWSPDVRITQHSRCSHWAHGSLDLGDRNNATLQIMGKSWAYNKAYRYQLTYSSPGTVASQIFFKWIGILWLFCQAPTGIFTTLVSVCKLLLYKNKRLHFSDGFILPFFNCYDSRDSQSGLCSARWQALDHSTSPPISLGSWAHFTPPTWGFVH